MKTLTVVTGTPSTGTPSAIVAQRQTILDTQNKSFIRNIIVTSEFIMLSHGSTFAGIALEDFMLAMAALESGVTWAPIITVQPSNSSVTHPAAASFSITATAETSITYQWQISSDSGATWSNQSNGGVYSGCTTNTMAISDSTGLTGKQYRCQATNASGTTTSNAATLTVA